MRIGSIGVHFQPYIYNTNTVSANSLNKISGIEEDALKSSVDYSNDKNENPLKPGETSNFMDVLARQFQLGQNNAARVMKTVEENPFMKDAAVAEDQIGETLDTAEDTTMDASETFDHIMEKLEISTQESASQIKAVRESDTSDYSNSNTGNNGNLFMMNRAIEAYTAALAV